MHDRAMKCYTSLTCWLKNLKKAYESRPQLAKVCHRLQNQPLGKFSVSSGVLQKLVCLTAYLLLISSSDLNIVLHRCLMAGMGTILKTQWAKPALSP